MRIIIRTADNEEFPLIVETTATPEDLDRIMCNDHGFNMHSLDFYAPGDDEPMLPTVSLVEDNVRDDTIILAKPAGSRAAGGGGALAMGMMGANLAEAERAGAWAQSAYATKDVPKHCYVRTGLNLRVSCDHCRTTHAYLKIGICEGCDVVDMQFPKDEDDDEANRWPAFVCPVEGCGKVPKFQEVIFSSPAAQVVRFKVWGNYVQDGFNKVIKKHEARQGVCPKNRWIKPNESVLGPQVSWLKLFISCYLADS
jgi:hypothetical protein